MATASDKLIGLSLVAVSAIIFSYYTIWVVILPFVFDDHVIHRYFLPQMYAIIIPIILGLIGVIGLGSFIGFVIVQSKLKND